MNLFLIQNCIPKFISNFGVIFDFKYLTSEKILYYFYNKFPKSKKLQFILKIIKKQKSEAKFKCKSDGKINL